MKKLVFRTSVILLTALAMLAVIALLASGNVFAAEEAAEATAGGALGVRAIVAGGVVGLAGVAGAISMGLAISKSNESISRQPEAAGDIRTALMLGLVFIETVIIYALIVAILVIFVL